MIGAILQPSFLPWRGFFDLIYRSDVFVFLDDVQFDKNSWRNRNRIKTRSGHCWITIPVLTKGKSSQKLLETRICQQIPWKRKILHAVSQNYSKARYFQDYYPEIAQIFEQDWDLLSELDIRLVLKIMDLLGLKRTVCRSSELKIQSHDKNDRIIQICRSLGIRHYISGPRAKEYIEEERFRENDISISYMTYDYPPYEQLHGEFDPQVSIIDLLFNKGPEAPRFIWDMP